MPSIWVFQYRNQIAIFLYNKKKEAVGGAKNKQRRLHRVEEIQAIGIRKLPVDSRATDTGC